MNEQAQDMTIRVSVADLYPGFETGSTLAIVESHQIQVHSDAEIRATGLGVYAASSARDVLVEGKDNHYYIEVRLMPVGWVEGDPLLITDVEYVSLGLQPDGAIVFSGSNRQTFAEIQSLTELGLQDGDPRHLIAFFLGGRGGDSAELLQIIDQVANHLLWLGIDSGIAWASNKVFRGFWRKRGLRTARLIATDWAKRGLTSSAYLREFVERRRQWDLNELSRLLRIKSRQTRRLLSALGFDRDSRGTWSPGHSKQARRRREEWLNDEQRNEWWTGISA